MRIECFLCGKVISEIISNEKIFEGDIKCSECLDNPIYPERHFQGLISIEKEIPKSYFSGDIGIQIGGDGRIWVCIDGEAFIRFRPQK
jgi:hypothetical protein